MMAKNLLLDRQYKGSHSGPFVLFCKSLREDYFSFKQKLSWPKWFCWQTMVLWHWPICVCTCDRKRKLQDIFLKIQLFLNQYFKLHFRVKLFYEVYIIPKIINTRGKKRGVQKHLVHKINNRITHKLHTAKYEFSAWPRVSTKPRKGKNSANQQALDAA